MQVLYFIFKFNKCKYRFYLEITTNYWIVYYITTFVIRKLYNNKKAYSTKRIQIRYITTTIMNKYIETKMVLYLL